MNKWGINTTYHNL